MGKEDSAQQNNREEPLQLIHFFENLVAAQDLDGLAAAALENLAGLNNEVPIFMHLQDARLPRPLFFQEGFDADLASWLHDHLAPHCMNLRACREALPVHLTMPTGGKLEEGYLYPLQTDSTALGYMIMAVPAAHEEKPAMSTRLTVRMVNLIATAVDRMIERTRHERQLAISTPISRSAPCSHSRLACRS